MGDGGGALGEGGSRRAGNPERDHADTSLITLLLLSCCDDLILLPKSRAG